MAGDKKVDAGITAAGAIIGGGLGAYLGYKSGVNDYNSKTGKPKSVTPKVTSNDIKSSIIYKLFPTIDTSSISIYIDPDKLKNFKTSGLKDKNFLMKCIEKVIWEYEKGVSDITGVSEKDIKGNIDVFSLEEILNNETIILNTHPKDNSSLSKKLPTFFWDIIINLRTGECDVDCAGD
jgi:hypothetical protein